MVAKKKTVTKRKTRAKKARAKAGRPSKLDNLDRKQVERLAKKGWTDAEMAAFYEVTEQTWNNWKKKDPEFFESLKDWKAEADHEVERSLYERATGYSHPDSHISNYQGEITVTAITKHYPPDSTAAIFWLKNRKPGEWRDKLDHEHSGPGGGPLQTVVILPAKDAGD